MPEPPASTFEPTPQTSTCWRAGVRTSGPSSSRSACGSGSRPRTHSEHRPRSANGRVSRDRRHGRHDDRDRRRGCASRDLDATAFRLSAVARCSRPARRLRGLAPAGAVEQRRSVLGGSRARRFLLEHGAEAVAPRRVLRPPPELALRLGVRRAARLRHHRDAVLADDHDTSRDRPAALGATQREVYPGEWLPEPLAEEDAAQHAEMADSLSLAFLHLLEKLSPVERAVFLLREVFDYPHEDVARIVDKSAANSRQILARAHAHMDEGRSRFDVSRAEREDVARRFIDAWETGDTDALVAVLAPDATVHGDGGGKARAIREPLVGALRVAKALIGWRQMAIEQGVTYRAAMVNGERGVVYYRPTGSVAGVQELEIADGVVVAIQSILNHDKLAHLSMR